MPGTSPNRQSPPRLAGGGPGSDAAHRSPGRIFVVRVGGVASLTIAALIVAAVIVGSHPGTSDRVSHARAVSGAEGVAANAQLVSDLPPVAPRQFNRPIAQYRAYAGLWALRLAHAVKPLTAALRAGRRDAARRDWMTAFSDYLQLGAVYGLLPAGVDNQLARSPSATSDDDFPGLHRIEKGLWTGQSLRSLVPISARLSRAVVTLRHVLPSVVISPLDYATRAHEILEDAQRDLMSGTAVPWSGAGVLGTAAGLAATQKVISTLVPLLDGRDDTLEVTQDWLSRFQEVLATVRRPNGTYPRLDQLSPGELERIDGTLAGTLGALSQVPGTLETTQIRPIPTIPVATR